MGYFKSTGHAALAQLLDHGRIPPLLARVLLARAPGDLAAESLTQD